MKSKWPTCKKLGQEVQGGQESNPNFIAANNTIAEVLVPDIYDFEGFLFTRDDLRFTNT